MRMPPQLPTTVEYMTLGQFKGRMIYWPAWVEFAVRGVQDHEKVKVIWRGRPDGQRRPILVVAYPRNGSPVETPEKWGKSLVALSLAREEVTALEGQLPESGTPGIWLRIVTKALRVILNRQIADLYKENKRGGSHPRNGGPVLPSSPRSMGD